MDMAKVEGAEIVIRVPISGLDGAAFEGLMQVGAGDQDDIDKIDRAQLAADIANELNAEQEDGTTLVCKALDRAVINASEHGAESLSVLDD